MGTEQRLRSIFRVLKVQSTSVYILCGLRTFGWRITSHGRMWPSKLTFIFNSKMLALCGIIQRILYIKWQMHYFYPQEAAIGISLQMPSPHTHWNVLFQALQRKAHMGLKELPFPEVLRRWQWKKWMKNVGNHIHEKRQVEQQKQYTTLGRKKKISILIWMIFL